MSGIQKILVGFDFSEGCLAALHRAKDLAKSWGASLEVVHVLQDIPYSGATQNVNLVDWMGQLEAEINEELSRKVRELVTEDIPVSLQVLTGSPPTQLLKYAYETNASLLILGHGSHSSVEELLLGKTLEGVLQNSLIPVWIEKGRGSKEIKDILIPTDFSDHSHGAVQLGLNLANRFKAQAHLLHAVEIPFVPRFSMLETSQVSETLGGVARQLLDEYAESLSYTGELKKNLVYGEAFAEIEKYIDENNIGLTVISSHGNTGFAAKVLGSVSHKVIRTANCPVLLARPDSLDFSWIKEAFSIQH